MHADLAAALLRAAERMFGPVEDVAVLTNEGLSRDDLERAIEGQVAGWKHGGLVFTDVWGGSCHQCGASAARAHGEIVVVTGLNLPTLIDYLHNRDALSANDLAERLLKKGQDSIRIQRGRPS
jgi:mannose/fructose-specific phosphotransferase system component IIA